MGLESVSYIDDLNITWPLGTDAKAEGDDHIRAVKKALKAAIGDNGTNVTIKRTAVATSGIYSSATANVYLATTGAGNVHLRPNGAASTLNEAIVNAAGDLILAGDIYGVDNIGYKRIGGGNTATSGASIALYGGAHATLADRALYDAAVHQFRAKAGTPTYGVLDINGFSVTGTLTATGNITASGGYFIGTAAVAVLGTSAGGSGGVYLRPVAYNLPTNETRIDANGNMTVNGSLTALTNIASSGTNLVLGNAGAGGNVYLRPNGIGSVSQQLTLNQFGELLVGGDVRSNLNFYSSGASTYLACTGAGLVGLRPNGTGSATEQLVINSTGPALTVNVTNASKVTAGSWLAISDARIKTVTGDYETGLDAILALQPRRFTFKGNNLEDQTNEGEAGLVCPQARAAAEGTEHVGLIAQEAEIVMPDLVEQFTAWIDGVEVNDCRRLDPTNVMWALVNAVKELTRRVEMLEVMEGA